MAVEDWMDRGSLLKQEVKKAVTLLLVLCHSHRSWTARFPQGSSSMAEAETL